MTRVPVCVLTNGTTMPDKALRAELSRADLVVHVIPSALARSRVREERTLQ